MGDKKIVQQSLAIIFKQNGYSDLHVMTQRDFEHISDQLQKKAGIVISGITIKRLANGDFSRIPQIATLNAIANYFDFRTWQDYKASIMQSEEEITGKIQSGTSEKKPLFSRKIQVSLTMLVLIPITFYLCSNFNRNQNFDKAAFSVHRNTKTEIPNTVVFKYNIDKVKADSFFIQQSWDRNRRIKIYKNKYTVTDIYYEPGYHIAKLIANDSIIKAVTVSIPTDRWFFCANENKVKYRTEYIKVPAQPGNGIPGVTAADLLRNKIDPNEEKAYVYSYFPGMLKISSENFSLKTRVRMKEVRNNFCPYITIEVFCQRYMMMIKSTSAGCASEAFLRFGEKEFSGKETDLAAIAYDVTQWTDVELTVKNKHAVIKINGKECFSAGYQNATKLISGLVFLSNGLCEIDHVALTGSDGISLL